MLTQPASVVDGAVLDFGTRGFEIRSSGRLDVGTSVVTLRAGSFTVVTSGTAVSITGPGPSGGTEGGALTVEVMRRCSGNAGRRCLADSDCAAASAGTCTSGSGAASIGGKVTGNVDLTGAFILRAAGPISITQTVQMNGASLEADGGVVELDSGDSVSISAIVSADSGGQGAGGEVDITAVVDITISARERMTMFPGSKVTADLTTGSNAIAYRTSEKPPVLGGTITPTPTLKLDKALIGCPVCGNREIDAGETCDDGNRVSGDGCSSDCQDEGCVAGTPGYPAVPLCDDGDPCSLDTCNTVTHSCTYVHSCDDGLDCTVDACVGDACVHTANDTACNSGTPCAAGFCNATSGCLFERLSGRCNDGLFCNGSDQCAGGACSVHSGDPCAGYPECRDTCDESADRCQTPAGTACSDDGRQCTADFCDCVGSCIHPDLSGPCDDRIFCNGPDFCAAGTCSIHAGDPCVNAGACQGTCDETADVCASEPGIPCADDGNFCTDDVCDGRGGCGHIPYATFSAVTASVVRKGGPDNDRFSLKATLPAASLTVSPTVSGLRFQILDDAAATIFSCDVPAGSFTDVKGDGSQYRFRDKSGTLTGANGVYLATVRRNLSHGTVAVRLKGRDYDIPAIVNKPQVSAALGFGTQAGSTCFADVALSCAARGARVSCAH